MKIKPVGDRILLKIIKIQEQIINKNIVLPDVVTFGGNIGVAEVIGIGQGYLSDKKTENNQPIWEPLETKVGEKIIFNSRAGLGLSKTYRIIRESEIIAKLTADGIDIGDELLGGDEE